MKTVRPINDITSNEYADLKDQAEHCLALVRGVESALVSLKTNLDHHQIDLRPIEDETEDMFLIRVAEHLNELEYETIKREENERIKALRPGDAPAPRSWFARTLNRLARVVG